MKKLLLLIPLLAAFVFCGCKKNDDQAPVELTFNNAKVTMKIGSAPLQLAVTAPEQYTVNQELTWISNNPDIASVSKTGVVTAIGPGIVIITGYVNGSKTVRGECQVTVSGKLETSITTDADKYEIKAGDTAKVKYAYAPAINTSWQFDVLQSDTVGSKYLELTTDNEDSKKFGLVEFKGLQPGIVNVTLVNRVDNTVKKTFQVTITDVAVQSFTLDKTAYTVNLGQTDTVAAKILPEVAAYRALYYKSSNSDVFTIDAKGVISPVAVGSAVVYVTTQDGQKVSAPVTILPNDKIAGISFATKAAEFSLQSSTDMVGLLTLSTNPAGGAPITVTVDNTYAPESGLKSNISIMQRNPDGTQWAVVAAFGKSSHGAARLIATNGAKGKDGKLLTDTCIVTIKGMDSRLLLPKSQYYGVELGAKTIVTASASRFEFKQGVTVTLQEAVLFLSKGTVYYDADKKQNVKLDKDMIIEKLTPNIAVNPASTVTVDFTPLASAPHWKSSQVKYLFKTSDGVNEALYTLTQQVVAGNGTPFAAHLR